MKEILFVQGGGRGVHDEWDIKLVESLRRELGQRYEIRYPRMPNEDDPKLATWQSALEKEFASLHGASSKGEERDAILIICYDLAMISR
jgi:hypothetical protein